MVSHDMRLISQVAETVWECKDRTITQFKGTIEAYKALLKEEVEQSQRKFEREARRGK